MGVLCFTCWKKTCQFGVEYIYIYIPWKSKTKQRMVFRMIHIKDSLLPMGKVWSLDSQGILCSLIPNHLKQKSNDERKEFGVY